MVSVVFPAAGSSVRMRGLLGNVTNKNFLELTGETVLLRTLKTFSQSERVDFLIIVVAAGELKTVEKLLGSTDGLKPWKITTGGSERQYSIANGLRLVPKESDIILVHDAARPLVSVETIDAVIEGAEKFGAAIAAVPAKDTIKIKDRDEFVKATPQRATLAAVQTPQGFRRDILLRAYEKAEEDDFLGTDDAMLVERLGVKIKIIRSDYRNIKITTPEDIQVANMLLSMTRGGGNFDFIVKWATELQSLAQAGLFYGAEKFDLERYRRIREISVEMLAHKTEVSLEKIPDLFCDESGYQTPKVDTRAAIFENGKILLVHEATGKWSLPGGWCDVGISPAENTVKESKEEAGVNVIVKKVIAVYDRAKHNQPKLVHSVTKIFYLCEKVSGGFVPNIETTESGYFNENDLPELDESKVTAEQISTCFAASRAKVWETVFD